MAPLAAVIGTVAMLSLTGMSTATAATTHESAPPTKTASASPRIIDGSTADFAKAPFAAREFVNGSFNCSASLISSTWIILAKHCVEDQNGNPTSASSISFKVGSADLNGGTTVKVKKVARWSEGDVALAQLTAPYQGSYATLGGTTPAAGAPGDIYGWGRTAQGAPAASKLKTASVSIVGTDDQGWPGPSIVEKRVNGQAYKGDSGGPLIVNAKLVGVCSGTNSYNQPDEVEYASVPASASWITSTSGVTVN